MSENQHTWGWHEDLGKSIWEINQKIKELEQRLLELKGYEDLYDRIIGGEIFKQVPIIKELNEKIEMLKSSSHIDVTTTLLRINDATNILRFASTKDIEKLDAKLQKHGHDDLAEDFSVKFAELEENLNDTNKRVGLNSDGCKKDMDQLKELEQKLETLKENYSDLYKKASENSDFILNFYTKVDNLDQKFEDLNSVSVERALKVEKLETGNKSAKDFCGEQIKVNDLVMDKLKELEQRAKDIDEVFAYDIEALKQKIDVLHKPSIEPNTRIGGALLEGEQALKPDYLCNRCEHQNDSAEFGCDIEGNLAQAMLCREFKQKEDGESSILSKQLDKLDTLYPLGKEEQECKGCDYDKEEDCSEGCMKTKYEEEQEAPQELPRLCDECHQIRHCNPIGINFYCKECELIFKCPKCNISLNPSTTSATGDNPDENYYQCPNCLRHYPQEYLKAVAEQKEKEVDTSYYMSQAEKDVFSALKGDEKALKRISESNLIFEVPKKSDYELTLEQITEQCANFDEKECYMDEGDNTPKILACKCNDFVQKEKRKEKNNERFCQNCGETVGDLICAKCNENTIKVYERKQEQKDIVQFLAEFKCLRDYLMSVKYDWDSKEEYYNTVKEKWESKQMVKNE